MTLGIGAALLVAPLHELLTVFGSPTAPGTDPGAPLRGGADTAEEARRACRCALDDLAWGWTGAAADQAVRSGERVLTDTLAAVDRGTTLATAVLDATVTVVSGAAELERIIASFVALAERAAPVAALPHGQLMLLVAALEHLREGLDVATRVITELADLTLRVNEQLTGLDPAPAGDGAPPPAPGEAGPGTGTTATFGPGAATGSGVEVALPDGSMAVAPNPTAAEAVRKALEAQGTPYSWGGNTPGVALDCSGLTQWAYREAGLELPRLAQEQDVGTPVAPDAVQPGDLAVWDGHVAMVVGNGMMIEAGDPVSVTPIRTSNAGMGFAGFYRPTAG